MLFSWAAFEIDALRELYEYDTNAGDILYGEVLSNYAVVIAGLS